MLEADERKHVKLAKKVLLFVKVVFPLLIASLPSWFQFFNIKPEAFVSPLKQFFAMLLFPLPIPVSMLLALILIIIIWSPTRWSHRSGPLKNRGEYLIPIIRPEGEQIVITFHSTPSKIKVWLNLINFSDKNLILDKMLWDLHYDPFHKKGAMTTHLSIIPGLKKDVLIEETLTDSDKGILQQCQASNTKSYRSLTITLIYSANGKQFESKETFKEPFVDLQGCLSLTEQEMWILQNLANLENRKISEEQLRDEFRTKFNMEISAFNISINNLKKNGFIDQVDTKIFIGGAGHTIVCWQITSKGLDEIKMLGKK